MATYGGGCSSRANGLGGGRTYITPYTIGISGVLSSFCIYMNTGGTIKLKVFRDDGTNWVFVGESDYKSVSVGLNSDLTCSINVQSGDYIALYEGSGLVEISADGSSVSTYYQSTEVSSTQAKSSWSTANFYPNYSLLVTVGACSTYDDVYINSSTGNDSNCGNTSSNPVQTFAQAYSVRLNAGGTIYICNDGADFSGENITFTKPYSTAQGAAGVTNYKSPRFN